MVNVINELENNSLDINERVAKREAEVSLAKLLRDEEINWALRAKVRRVVQGDNNTQFFHMIANGKHLNGTKVQLLAMIILRYILLIFIKSCLGPK